MINIIICDDEELFARDLEKKINEIHLEEEYSISVYTTASKLQENILNGHKCDILFIDIELEQDIKGTDVVVRLKEIYPDMLVIYVSSHDTYYTAMVQAESFRFLKKPLEKESISNVLDTAINRLKKQESAYKYTYKFDREIHIVDLKEIAYIYSENKKIYLHFKSGEETFFYSKLDIVEQEVGQICDMFIRISKSYIINFSSMHKFGIDKVCVKDNKGLLELSIGRKYKDMITNRYMDSVIQRLKQ